MTLEATGYCLGSLINPVWTQSKVVRAVDASKQGNQETHEPNSLYKIQDPDSDSRVCLRAAGNVRHKLF